VKFARVQQLAQITVSGAGSTATGVPTTLMAGGAENTECTRIAVVFTATGGGWQLFHDDDGTTFSDATIVYSTATDGTLGRTDSIVSPAIGSGWGLAEGGSLGVLPLLVDATFTVYGVVEDIGEET
jgi:hypothetical protein